MISARSKRRSRFGKLAYWLAYGIISALLNLALLSLLLRTTMRMGTVNGAKEQIAQTLAVTIAVQHTPAPQRPAHRATVVPPSASAAAPRHELTRTAPHAPPQPPRPHVVQTRIARDEAAFAKEVAQLNAGNNPRAIPTIDPASQESSAKSYQMTFSSGAGQYGNGLIIPTRSWHDHGLDCYYGRYSYTYPDGSEEYGSIVWPFCFDPGADPFHQPPHPIPFPLPLPGYRLPPGTQLPKIEQQVYAAWAAEQ